MQRPYPSSPIKFMIYYLRHHKLWISLLMIALILSAIFSRIPQFLFAQLIDIMADHIKTRSTVWQTAGILIAVILIIDLIQALWRYLVSRLIRQIEPVLFTQPKRDIMEYVLNHSVAYLNAQQMGKIITKAEQLLGGIQRLFWTMLWGFYFPAIGLIITLILLAMINGWFAVLFIFWMAILSASLLLTSSATRKYSKNRAERAAAATGAVTDALGNHMLVKSFANLFYEKKWLNPLIKSEREATVAMIKKMDITRVSQTGIIALFNISTVVAAIELWRRDLISAGDIVFVLLLTASVGQIFVHFMHDLLDWYKTIGIMNSALSIISTPHDINDAPNAKKLRVTKGAIRFDRLFFSYSKGRPIFKNFTLTLSPGERVGLVGASGSGKSTLISLLQRFYDVTDGSIRIDGQDIAGVTQNSLHKNISVIPQDTSLFHRSLMENIRYGNPTATDKQVIRAAKLAFAHNFIMQTDRGYDSLVGDRGVRLSGGQRQRIAIARAILKNAPILILDEATSALDSESERYIQKSMARLMRGKTVIAIAHRLSTLKEMNRIVVMSRGRIIEQGPPAELLKNRGKYAKLWELQTEQK